MMVLGQKKVILFILGGTESAWGGTGWYLEDLGHFNLVLLVI